MKRRSLVSSGTLNRLRDAARVAWEYKDIPKCFELLESARRLAPADPSLLIQQGRVHGMLHDYAAAEQCYETALRFTPPPLKAQTLVEIGQQSRDFYSRELARTYLERAVAEKASPDSLVRLAELSERLRQIDKANELVDRALGLDARFGPALLARGRLAHRANKLEEAETHLRPLLALSVHPEVRIRAGYELGAVLDRQGRYDEAMSAFLGAKALLQHSGIPHLAHIRQARKYYDEARAQLTPEVIKRWRAFGQELGSPRRLTLLGGHPRSGTTLLEQVLDSHPDIVSAEETTNFADRVYLPHKRLFPDSKPMLEVLEAASAAQAVRYREDYFRAAELCLNAPLENRLLIDKNPSVTLLLIPFIRFFPESKLLIAIRDPRDVVLSCFMQAFVPVQDVSSAWLKLETTAEEYASLMGTWRAMAPLLDHPSIEVRYEDLVEDLESVARKTLNFLGMPWDERVLGFDEHARKKIVRSPTYADVTQKVFKRARGRWRNYQKYLEPHLPVLEPFVKAFGYEE